MEGRLAPRDNPYTLFVSTFDANKFGAFTITVYTRGAELARPMSGSKDHLPRIPTSVAAT